MLAPGSMRSSIAIAAWTLCVALAACGDGPAERCPAGGCARDAAQVDAGGAGADAAPQAGASGSAGSAEFAECQTADDCPVPEGLLQCSSCQDGSEACMQIVCVEQLCATRPARLCPELASEAGCSGDLDCPRPDCTSKCQGDGRDACLRSRCINGRCLPTRSTCGLQIEPCPDGTRASVECAACDPDGGCAFDVLGCFQTCETDPDCPAEQPCTDGLCQFAPDCG